MDRLVAELRARGYAPTTPEPDFVTFPYPVDVGPLAGDTVEIGFKVPADYSLSAPGGLLVRPHVLPMNGNGGDHPWCGVHACETGGIHDASYQYWSRPHPDWSGSTRDADALMAHVRRLFDTLPEDLRVPCAA